MPIRVEQFGSSGDRNARRITMESQQLRAVLTDQGARLMEFHAPDRIGRMNDIVLGHPNLDALGEDTTYFGATCGRYANRIQQGRFALDEEIVSLETNEGDNHLHGGPTGFDRRTWSLSVDEDRDTVTFSLTSTDGDQGYPGELYATCAYTLADTTLDIRMTATTTRPTVVNLVHHSYWNLGGHNSGNVLEHLLEIDSDFFTPVDDALIPTGEVLSVAGTVFDFRTPTKIGKGIAGVEGGAAGRDGPRGFAGYDHNWVVRGQQGRIRPCAGVFEPVSGRRMRLLTNEVGVQMYAGGYLDDVEGKHGATYGPFDGFTLETQRFPDSPNHGHFPSAVLRPGESYDHRMLFEFSTE